jgi:hypothetical protein
MGWYSKEIGMSDLNAGKNSMGKMLFGILLVFMLALLGAGAYLGTRSNRVISSEKVVLPVTGKNVDPEREANILPPQANKPAENAFEDFGGGFTLIINPDGSEHMITPNMIGNPERSAPVVKVAGGGSYALGFNADGSGTIYYSTTQLQSDLNDAVLVRRIAMDAGYAEILLVSDGGGQVLRPPAYDSLVQSLESIDLGEGYALIINADGSGTIVPLSTALNAQPAQNNLPPRVLTPGHYMVIFKDRNGRVIPVSALYTDGNGVKK